ncbi:FadR/GntR family transcriptional regulator [Paraburkholderia tropica]|uniref:FadR/GntR family transcriptional regulator n=1 Tax=Paraburkholderia tropica TaxID=92647 RepID=UPI002AB74C6F|nr:GntR family transcriptional regulator [Paraburkholderia tropica]
MQTTGTHHEQSGPAPSLGSLGGAACCPPRRSDASQVKRTIDFLVSQYVTQPTARMLPPQEALALALDVSRSVVREAVSLLQAKGIVSVQPRLGTSIVDERQWRTVDADVVAWRTARAVDDEFARDVSLVLRLIEPSAASLAARHTDPAGRVRLAQLCEACLGTPDAMAYHCGRHALRIALLVASGNQMMVQMANLSKAMQVPGGVPPAAHESIRQLRMALDAASSTDALRAMQRLVAAEAD